MIWKIGSHAGLLYPVVLHWTLSTPSQFNGYDVKKAIHQRNFVVSKAYVFNEGMYPVKSHDGIVGMYWEKLEDCTHKKYATALNSGTHIRGNIDDCTCMKYDMSAPGTMFRVTDTF